MYLKQNCNQETSNMFVAFFRMKLMLISEMGNVHLSGFIDDFKEKKLN